MLLNPFCPLTTAKVRALKVAVLLLLTLLIKARVQIVAGSALCSCSRLWSFWLSAVVSCCWPVEQRLSPRSSASMQRPDVVSREP